MTKKKKKQNNKNIFKQKKITEEDFLIALDNISKKLIYKFKFGYHDLDDMKQQAAIFAMEGLKNYDSSRPLENFLWTHVRNRLFNFKRDNYSRPDNVCIGCPFFDPKFKKSENQCEKFTNKQECSIYYNWSNRNDNKKKLMQTVDSDSVGQKQDSNNDIADLISNSELLDFIEENIHLKYRDIYLKIKGGCKVSKSDLDKLKSHITSLLEEK